MFNDLCLYRKDIDDDFMRDGYGDFAADPKKVSKVESLSVVVMAYTLCCTFTF